MKDVGLRIRINRELREQFINACTEDHKPAAQVLREFMRAYIEDRKKQKSEDSSNDPR
jgi:predicted DNA-binding protein